MASWLRSINPPLRPVAITTERQGFKIFKVKYCLSTQTILYPDRASRRSFGISSVSLLLQLPVNTTPFEESKHLSSFSMHQYLTSQSDIRKARRHTYPRNHKWKSENENETRYHSRIETATIQTNALSYNVSPDTSMQAMLQRIPSTNTTRPETPRPCPSIVVDSRSYTFLFLSCPVVVIALYR